MIIGLSGYAGSGKDVIADVLVPEGFERLSFAEVIRKAMYALNPIVSADTSYYNESVGFERYAEVIDAVGYTQAKADYPEIRELLQRLGTEVGRDLLGPDVWVDAAMNNLDPSKNYVCTDMRFPNEYWAIRERGGVCVKVNRPGVGPVNNHPSETAIDDMDYDHEFNNDGTIEDLAVQVIQYLHGIRSTYEYVSDFSINLGAFE